MADQNFKNHTRMVPLYHYAAFATIFIALIIAGINFFKAVSAASGRVNAAGYLSLIIGLLLVCWFARAFALKAQDRAIRAEENLRHFIATGKPFDSRLRMGQIIGLRFAGDDEFVELAKRAANENLSPKQIKEAIKNWKADNNRV
jgi:hypothetical protein